MSDLIRVVDLEVWTRLGVPADERATPQKLLVTLEMQVAGFSAVATTDDISQTVDYAQVARHIQSFAATGSRKLLETFADKLAHDLLAAFPIKHLRLEVKKFILPDAACVSVEIERPL